MTLKVTAGLEITQDLLIEMGFIGLDELRDLEKGIYVSNQTDHALQFEKAPSGKYWYFSVDGGYKHAVTYLHECFDIIAEEMHGKGTSDCKATIRDYLGILPPVSEA
ncbi:MAG: hypothetical protein DWQ19_09605 [Crenarchaeota archaeon]|nr:MAG: hypothetical protein DWQ19_09605 [Thermoproteota archaeon]